MKLFSAFVVFGAVAAVGAAGDLQWVNPAIEGEGKVVVLDEAAVQPKAGSKVVFDVSTQKEAEGMAKGLGRAARWINLNAGSGVEPEELRIAVVFHGSATKAVLGDEAYAKHARAKGNPNLDLLRKLKEMGVELYVCGQALAHHGYEQEEVVPEVEVATAAMTVLVQKQQEGYAYLPY